MMYKKNVVAAIKVGGKILRESGNIVQLPFGSEYSVLLKNLNTVRVMAKVTIDGQEVTGNRWLVINPNDSLELERFIKDGNLHRGNKLKFIERNEDVEEARGIKAEDGLIRVEWKTEKTFEIPKIVYHKYWYEPRPFKYSLNQNAVYTSSSGAASGGILGASFSSNNSAPTRSLQEQSCNFMKQAQSNEAGITVPGSESKQKFIDVLGFTTEIGSEVLVLKLVGRHGKQPVSHPVTVDIRPTCSTCQKKSKAGARFCSSCGTSLELI